MFSYKDQKRVLRSYVERLAGAQWREQTEATPSARETALDSRHKQLQMADFVKLQTEVEQRH